MNTTTLKPGVKHKVMLVDDHPVVLQGLANVINDEPDLMVCGTAAGSEDALRLAPQLSPEVVLLDISLGDQNSLDLIKQLHGRLPEIPILILSMHDETLYAERALRAGAQGYIMKSEPMDQVMAAIRRVLGGEVSVSRHMSTRLLRKMVDNHRREGLESLSDREFEIFSLIAIGVGPTEIGQRLDVSVKTVETHRERIKEKLGLKSAAELTRFAVEWEIKLR